MAFQRRPSVKVSKGGGRSLTRGRPGQRERWGLHQALKSWDRPACGAGAPRERIWVFGSSVRQRRGSWLVRRERREGEEAARR